MSRRVALLAALLLAVTGVAMWLITAESSPPAIRTQAQVSAGVRVPFEDIYADPRPDGCEAYKARLVRTDREQTATGTDYTVVIRNVGKSACTLDGTPNVSVDRQLGGLDQVTSSTPEGAVSPAVLTQGQLGYVRLSTSRVCGKRDRHDLDSLIFPDAYELLVHIPLDSGCPVGVSQWYRLGPPPPPLPKPGPGWEQVTVSVDTPTPVALSSHVIDYTLELRNAGDRDLDLTSYCPTLDWSFRYGTFTARTAQDRRLNCAAVPGKLLPAHGRLRFQMLGELDSIGSLQVTVTLVDLHKSDHARVQVHS